MRWKFRTFHISFIADVSTAATAENAPENVPVSAVFISSSVLGGNGTSHGEMSGSSSSTLVPHSSAHVLGFSHWHLFFAYHAVLGWRVT